MIGDTMSLMQSAENLSIPQLQQSIQSGTLPAYIGIPILQRKLKQKQEALAPEVPPTATQPVASQVMSQARGLPVLPSNLSFADGGIVAFSEGGPSKSRYRTAWEAEQAAQEARFAEAAKINRLKGIGPTFIPSSEEIQSLSLPGAIAYDYKDPKYRQAVMNVLGHRPVPSTEPTQLQANPTQAPITTGQPQATELAPEQVDALDTKGADLGTLQKTATNLQNKLTNLRNAGASQEAIQQAESDYELAQEAWINASNQNVGFTEKGKVQYPNAVDQTSSTPYAIAPPPASTTPSAFPTAAWESMQPTAEERDPAAQAAQMRAMLGEDPERAKLVEKIAKREEDLGLSERRAPWLALMQAGLATMGGKSPFAMANIGEGGIAGINAYMKSQDRLEDQRDKLLDMQGKLADKKRSEDIAVARYGMDSSQAAKAAARTTKQAELTQQQAYEANKAKMEFDYWNAQQRYGLEAQQVSQQGRYYGAMAENARKDPETIRVFNEISQDPANKGKSVTELMGMAYNITRGVGDTAEHRSIQDLNATLKNLYAEYNAEQDQNKKAEIFAAIKAHEARLAQLHGVQPLPTPTDRKPIEKFYKP